MLRPDARTDPRRWNLMTLAEAGRELGVTRARVCQMISQGLLQAEVCRDRRYVTGTSVALLVTVRAQEQPSLLGKE